MPFISKKDKRQDDQSAVALQDYRDTPTTMDTISAGLSSVKNEDQFFSFARNRDAEIDRLFFTEQLIASGEINRQDYFKETRTERNFDWDKLSSERSDIKSDAQLKEERTAFLKKEREKNNDILERGSGIAGFAGKAVGYITDPVALATLPISASANGLRGLAAIGRVAAKTAATELAAETLIQTSVVSHKADINSPYGWKDAILSMGISATGAGILGGSAKGISEYISSIRAKSKSLPQTSEVKFADQSLGRVEELVSNNPLRKEGMTSKEMIKADTDFLEQLEIKRTQAPLKRPKEDVVREKVKVGEDVSLTVKEKSILDAAGETEEYLQDIAKYRSRFPKVDELALAAKVEQDLPEKFVKKEVIKSEVFKTRTAELAEKGTKNPEKEAIKQLEAEFVAASRAQRKAASQLNRVTITMDEKAVDSSEFIDGIDAELDGIDSILRCLNR
jgi:hypothetical protein